jgi:hypothetical protein
VEAALWLLAVVVIVAHLTVLSRLARRSEEQAAASRRLFEMSQRQYELARMQYESTEKRLLDQQNPCVIAAWRYQPAPARGFGDGWDYVARNLGPGRAFNILLILNYDQEPSFHHIGSLAAGDDTRLPQEAIATFNQLAHAATGAASHLLIATPATGTPWVLTDNRINPNNRVSQRISIMTPDDAEARAVSRGELREYLVENWGTYRVLLPKRFGF